MGTVTFINEWLETKRQEMLQRDRLIEETIMKLNDVEFLPSSGASGSKALDICLKAMPFTHPECLNGLTVFVVVKVGTEEIRIEGKLHLYLAAGGIRRKYRFDAVDPALLQKIEHDGPRSNILYLQLKLWMLENTFPFVDVSA